MEIASATIPVADTAKLLGVSVQSVHRLIDAGLLDVAYQFPGGKGAKLLSRTSVEKYAAERQAS